MCGYCGCFRMVLKGPTNLHSTSVIHRWADFRSQTLIVIPPVVALTPLLCRTRLSCQYLGFLKKKCNSKALCRSLPPHSWNVSGNLHVPLAQISSSNWDVVETVHRFLETVAGGEFRWRILNQYILLAS